MSSQIIRGNALNLPLADDSVDLVVTSPPYWSLRAYQDNGETYDGQIGAEATPGEFVDALVECTREWMRVLKPSGSMWINLGDKYNAYNGNRGEGTIQANGVRQSAPKGNGLDVKDVRPKSLIGIPWRYALRCIDDLGLILRAEVIWSKPNGLPESVTDRVRRSHETWFHFTLNPRYYSAVDEVREAHNGRLSNTPQPLAERGPSIVPGNTPHRTPGPDGWGTNPLGKLPGSVWTVPTEPLRVPDHLGVDHFAAFPTEWPRRIITGWSPRGVCVECGAGRRPVAGKAPWWEEHKRENGIGDYLAGSYTPGEGYDRQAGRQRANNGASIPSGPKTVITGYACSCPEPTAPTTPGVVLDPFGGTGTTALVADALGRHGISVDMSRDYCRLAEWRTTDPKQRAKAARKPFTPAAEQVDGQASLLELIEEASA